AMTAGSLRVGFIQAIRPDIVAKQFYRQADGSLGKRAVATIVEGRYWSKPASTAQELAGLLRITSERPDTCVLRDTPKGDREQVVRTLPEAELARLLGANPRIGAAFSEIAGMLCSARLKEFFEPSGWLLFDCDSPPGMPAKWLA